MMQTIISKSTLYLFPFSSYMQINMFTKVMPQSFHITKLGFINLKHMRTIIDFREGELSANVNKAITCLVFLHITSEWKEVQCCY